jgi:hypothetical protein
MSLGLASNNLKDTYVEIIGTILANSHTQFPVFALGHCTTDVFIPATGKRRHYPTLVDNCNPDILSAVYSQVIDYVFTVRTAFTFVFDHVLILA